MSSARIAKVRRLEKERQKANNPFPNVCFNIFSSLHNWKNALNANMEEEVQECEKTASRTRFGKTNKFWENTLKV